LRHRAVAVSRIIAENKARVVVVHGHGDCTRAAGPCALSLSVSGTATRSAAGGVVCSQVACHRPGASTSEGAARNIMLHAWLLCVPLLPGQTINID
jgi:hypothetical protein